MSRKQICDGCGCEVGLPSYQIVRVTDHGDSEPLDFCGLTCVETWLERKKAANMPQPLVGTA